MAVTGAAMVLSTLPAISAGLSLALASGDLTNTIRIGQVLAEVGPSFARSYTCRRRSSSTGLGSQAEWVRASRKITSRQSAFTVFAIVSPRDRFQFLAFPPACGRYCRNGQARALADCLEATPTVRRVVWYQLSSPSVSLVHRLRSSTFTRPRP